MAVPSHTSDTDPGLAERELRVVSLLPSATELVCAVGMRAALVGVSHECDWPPGVEDVPVLTSTRLGGSGRSSQVDRDLRAVLREALSVYEVDVEGLRRAAPDVIVTQDLCDVCAVSLDDVRAAIDEIGRDVRLVNLRPTRLEHVFEGLLEVGAALGRALEARAVLAGLRARVEQVRRRASCATERPAVLTIEWIDPVMIGGMWMPELIELAGGTALVARAGQRAPTLTVEELAQLDPAPDVVLIKPCGFGLERTLEESADMRRLLEGFDWPARDGRIFVADGNAYFNRPGPRVVDSLELLAACIHPAQFPDHAATYATSFTQLRT